MLRQFKIGSGPLVWLHPQCRNDYAKAYEAEQAMGIPDAPNDGNLYVRQNQQWVEMPIPADAPADDGMYVRQNGQWARMPSGFSTSFAYTFSTVLSAPPANSQIRFNSPDPDQVTVVRLNNNDYDGFDESNLLKLIAAGFIVFVQDKSDPTCALKFRATGPAVNVGTYSEIPVELEVAYSMISDNHRVVVVVYGGG